MIGVIGMKKIITAFMATLLLTGCTGQEMVDNIKETVDATIANFQQDVKNLKDMPEQQMTSQGLTTLGGKMEKLNERKKADLAVLDKQIQAKQLEIAKILMDTKMPNDKKKVQTSELQKQINDLKQQKEHTIEMYRNRLRNFQYE